MGPAASLRHAAHLNAQPPAVADREQGGVPAKQALGRERLRVVLGGVQHHVHHAINMAIRRGERANGHAQPPGDAGAHGVQVQGFAFDGAGGDDFLREGLHGGLVALRQPQLGHAARQMPLCAVHLRQGRSQGGGIPAPLGPVGALP